MDPKKGGYSELVFSTQVQTTLRTYSPTRRRRKAALSSEPGPPPLTRNNSSKSENSTPLKDLDSGPGAMCRDQNLIYGDVVPNINKNADRCATSYCKWTTSRNRVKVPYTMDTGYSNEERRIIKKAMNTFRKSTCVKFIKKKRRHTDYIEIFDGSGCWSYIGRTGGKQQLSLKRNGCLYKSIVQHELLHALGFHHEQVRSDRDDYITVLFENIRAGLESQFVKEDTNNLGSPYDFNSVMQYSNKAFSKNGQPTLEAKSDPSLQFGLATELSSEDIARVNSLYCS
ncbi:hatching enzyme 1.2-like [Aulostomus maculatus]